MKPFQVLVVLVLSALVVQLCSDTHVPLRGTNTIPLQKNFPIEVPGKSLIMGISLNHLPPPLPTNNLARLRWIDGDVYELHWGEGDVILMVNKPILKQSKSGKWMLIYPTQAP